MSIAGNRKTGENVALFLAAKVKELKDAGVSVVSLIRDSGSDYAHARKLLTPQFKVKYFKTT
jgi:hypothetical protein